ncbi:MAG: AAA family ATPase [Planctomycetes bacterium]|nr:AAA family ATPase [Planctomycetota bacterium]
MQDEAPIIPARSQLVVLIGPAGCGKSTIGPLLAAALGVPFADGDDLLDAANIERMRRGRALDDAARGPWLDRIHAALVAADAAGQGLVVACSALKRVYRDHLGKGLTVRFVELTADATTLRQRLAGRPEHFFPPSLLDSQLAALQSLPERDRVDATRPPAAVVIAIRELLHEAEA